MPDLRGFATAGTALLIAFAVAGCGDGEPKADPVAIDQHLNQLIKNDTIERRRLVEEARDREEVREAEMEQRAAGHGESNGSEPGNEAAATD